PVLIVDVEQPPESPSEGRLVRPGWENWRASRLPKVRPALAAVIDVFEVQARFVEKPIEVKIRTLPPKRPQLVDLRRPSRGDRVSKAPEHDLRRLLIELHVAAGGKKRKLEPHCSLDVPTSPSQ